MGEELAGAAAGSLFLVEEFGEGLADASEHLDECAQAGFLVGEFVGERFDEATVALGDEVAFVAEDDFLEGAFVHA